MKDVDKFIATMRSMLAEYRYRDARWCPRYDNKVVDKRSFLDAMERMWDGTKDRQDKLSYIASEDGLIAAVTGVSKNAALHADIIHLLLNNAEWLADQLESLTKQQGETQ